MSSLVGVVLAGGKSSRMGQKKAELVFLGETLLARAWRCLTSVFPTCVVSTRSFYPDYPLVYDACACIGPLGALIAALTFAQARGASGVFVLACDMPRVTPDLVRRLAEAHRAREPSILETVYACGDREESLCAAYACAVLPFLQAARAQGNFALHRVVPSAQKLRLCLAPHEVPLLCNVNTQEDWNALCST